MLTALRVIILGLSALLIMAGVLVLCGVAGCSPPKTAAEAESCRMKVDRAHLPELVQEALGNCPHGGRVEFCVSSRTLEAYQAALTGCRESK